MDGAGADNDDQAIVFALEDLMDRITVAGHGVRDSSIAVNFRDDIGRFGEWGDLDDTQIINGIRHGMAPVWSYRAEQKSRQVD
jgi:hypothetical protein